MSCGSRPATDYAEATGDRLSEGLDLSKNAISSLAQPLLVGLGRLLRPPVAPNLEQIVRQTHQQPLATHLLQAPQQEATKSSLFFDLTKDRLHDHLAPGV
jgi:hypothetical protein